MLLKPDIRRTFSFFFFASQVSKALQVVKAP